MPKKLDEIYYFLDIDKKRFKSMTPEAWGQLAKQKLAEHAQDATTEEEKKKIQEMKVALSALEPVVKRKQVLALEEQNKAYEHLFVLTKGTSANQAKEATLERTKNPVISMIVQSADGKLLNYDIKGGNPKVIEKNKELILKEYKKYVKEKYKDLPLEEQKKYQPKEEFFKTVKEFEKSDFYKTLSDESKENYKNRDFPTTITSINFVNTADINEFLNRDKVKNCLKEPTVAQEEAEKATANVAPRPQ